MKTSRIGVFGGTFDPVHRGHIQLAYQAIKALSLSQLLLVPAAQPPHKHNDITSVQHRIAMIELACRSDDRLFCSQIERQLSKPSYTVDTLKALRHILPINSEIIFIIGVDAFLDFMTWKSYRTILSMVEIAVSPRVGYSEQVLFSFLNRLGYSKQKQIWIGPDNTKRITLLPNYPKAVCSSEVRKAVVKGEGTGQLLSREVARYIKENNLYNI